MRLPQPKGCAASDLRVPIGGGAWLPLRIEGEHDRRALAADLPDDSFAIDGAAPRVLIALDAACVDDELLAARGPWFEDFPGNRYRRYDDGSTLYVVSERGDHGLRAYFAAQAPLPTLPVRIELWRRAGAPSPAQLVARVARDLLQHSVTARGGFVLHCSLVERDGTGRAFVGDKGAGKSAWLTRSLAQCYNLVANDRVLFLDGEAIAYPIAAMLSPESLKNLPAAARRAAQAPANSSYRKLRLSPRAMADAYGVELRWSCRLERIALLRGHEGERGGCVQRPAAAAVVAEVLTRNVYYPADPTYGFDWCCRPLERLRQPAALVRSVTDRVAIDELDFDWAWFDCDLARLLEGRSGGNEEVGGEVARHDQSIANGGRG